MRRVIIIFTLSILFGQSKYPADSLLVSPEIPIIHKIGLIPIAGWQRISYNTKLLNCQFHPSCSNYGALAVKEFGVIRGGAMASERIVRCNPFALDYQLKYRRGFNQKDGRLEDTLIQIKMVEPKKSPILAAIFSAVLPGSGRIYAGRTLDGIMGSWVTFIIGNTAYLANKNKRTLIAPLYTSIFFFVYFGEIYGGWRATKYDELSKNKIDENSF